MDHTYIEEKGLIELYHQGALPPEEEIQFEAHFVNCPQCIEELEAARSLRVGIRTMVAEDAMRLEAATRVGVLARLIQLAKRPGVIIGVFGAVAAMLLGAWWLSGEFERLHSAAELAASDADSWQQRFSTERENSRELERRLADLEAADGPQAEELRSQLQQAIEARDRHADEVATLKQPRWNTEVFILSVLRSGSGSEPNAVIDLHEVRDWLSLAVEVDLDPRVTSYRVEIFADTGKILWRRDELEPNAFETLMVSFPSSYFVAGSYRLTVTGLTAAGDEAKVGDFTFEISGKSGSDPTQNLGE